MYLSSELYRAFVLDLPQNPLRPLEGQKGKLMRSKIPPHAVKLGGYVAGVFLRRPAQILPPLRRKFREETHETVDALAAMPFSALHAAEETADVMTAVRMFRRKVGILPLVDCRAPPEELVQRWHELCEAYADGEGAFDQALPPAAMLAALTEHSFHPHHGRTGVDYAMMADAMATKIAKVGDYDGWLVTCVVLPRTTDRKWLDMFTHYHEVDASLLREEEMLTPDQIHVVTKELEATRSSEEAFKDALHHSGLAWVESLRKHYDAADNPA